MKPAALVIFLLTAFATNASTDTPTSPRIDRALAEFGKALFFDVNLSKRRTQACASCHMPAHGFIDTRPNGTNGAASVGDDGKSLSDRNTPTLSYAALTPRFRLDQNNQYAGGLFYDGKADDLVKQAKEPLLNPTEMALDDSSMLSVRIHENSAYTRQVAELFDPDTLIKPELLHTAIAIALAEFQKTAAFLPFDSKYDRYLRGEYEMTRLEKTGFTLFFSDLLNCNGCHELNTDKSSQTFTDFTYHNIGVPANQLVRALNGSTETYRDLGLFDNPEVNDAAQQGKFKVPTLRNVAVTAPYMHNGVFAKLETVLHFYNKYLIRDTGNPETKQPWRSPEVDSNLSMDLLTRGQPLSKMHIDALHAFMETLTDRQFEHLLID